MLFEISAANAQRVNDWGAGEEKRRRRSRAIVVSSSLLHSSDVAAMKKVQFVYESADDYARSKVVAEESKR